MLYKTICPSQLTDCGRDCGNPTNLNNRKIKFVNAVNNFNCPNVKIKNE